MLNRPKLRATVTRIAVVMKNRMKPTPGTSMR
jgi:hypothetical protein